MTQDKNQAALIKKIKAKARQDQKKRRDLRYLNALGFFVAKGFLKTNQNVKLGPNRRMNIEDVIWAGKNVESRLLEVLPAAVLRLEKHFDFDRERYPELVKILEQLKQQQEVGDDFYEIPYRKLRVWVDFPLIDKRIKVHSEKKVTKTFRLAPKAIEKMKALAIKYQCSETEVLEKLLLN